MHEEMQLGVKAALRKRFELATLPDWLELRGLFIEELEAALSRPTLNVGGQQLVVRG
jgi:hypothetical protein